MTASEDRLVSVLKKLSKDTKKTNNDKLIENRSNINNLNYITKKEKKELINLVSNANIKDEDSMWNLGVELGRWSVRIRANILSEKE